MTKYEKWGNNEFHYPTLCDECEFDCRFCSNGPRGKEYRRAEAESRLNDMAYEASQWNGIEEDI